MRANIHFLDITSIVSISFYIFLISFTCIVMFSYHRHCVRHNMFLYLLLIMSSCVLVPFTA